jgi:ATP-dependent helicase HrpA
VAKRIASELHTPLGQVVGYKVRFQDRLEPGARVKLMTDGILLAETQRDPLLRAYDTLIIDEAHERSLNIDFLLGYLRQLLPKRPDLKLVITSATIDADRFARHFSSPQGPAPVIMVSGRTFPVEQRYRPFEESREYGLNHAVADAVDELWQGAAAGDILIFLPGEREIRDLADHLRGHLSHSAMHRTAEILPLFSRLSQADQERVFEPSGGRRIVLATNVAETSLTVPGIRYVIDTGSARVKRYSLRSKVEQLQVEPVSQAAANQRAGRCGRVADGICIRLYDEADFSKRPRFTDPEILRSSLAGVILRMKALGLGQIGSFPFIDPPSNRAISDGLQLLAELGALDDDQQLTPLGRELARLPLDPRVGRMVLEARTRNALDEVLVIASALSVQDVRDRPIEAQAQADQQHAKFKDDRSEFSSYLTLWRWLQDARGGHGQAHKLSNRQYEQLLKSNHIHVRRVREWRDVHSQLLTVVTEQGFKLNATPASYEQIHLSMLSGLLGNIGCKADDEEFYLGARGIRFHRHPGSHLRKKPGRWLVAAELVDTTRLYGRGLAAIEPAWLEQVGAHLLKKQWLDPRFDPKSGEVLAFERATLYGLVVYSGRKRPYAAVDPAGAREIFIREGLVAMGWDAKLPFLNANRKLVRSVQELEHKSRRQDVLVDEELIFAYYDAHIPATVCNGHDLQAWWKQASPQQPKLLHMDREDLMRHEAASVTAQAFPRVIRLGGVDCATDYLHQPGDARDGLTVTVPLFVLNQVAEERAEWLVPGMLKDKIQALLKSLPQKPRSRFVPLPDSASRLADELSQDTVFGQGSLTDVLLHKVRQWTSLDVKRADFKLDMVPPHLFMNFRIVDEHGRQLGTGRNLGALRAQWGHQARGAFQALAQLKTEGLVAPSATPNQAKASAHPVAAGHAKPGAAPHRRDAGTTAADTGATQAANATATTGPYTEWTFGELPELMEIRKGGQTLIGFPALVDQGAAVQIEVFDEPEVAQKKHQAGLRRLFALHIKDALKYLEKNIPDLQKMAVAYMALGTQDELRAQIIDLALDRAFLLEPWPSDATSFKTRLDEGRARLTLIANEVARLCALVLTEYAAAAKKIRDSKTSPQASADCAQQLQRLVGKTFVRDTPWSQMQHLVRYLKAIVMRLDKCRADPARDEQRMNEVKAQEQRYWRLVAERKGATDARMLEFRWLLEELRVSLFAQELRTPQPVSAKRLDKAWAQLN